MKYPTQLNDLHKSILKLVSLVSYSGIEYYDLLRGIELILNKDFIYHDTLDQEDIINISFGISSRNSLTDKLVEDKIQKSLNFLEEVGLLASVYVKTNPNEYFLPNETNGYKLTDEGKRIAELVKFDRKIRIKLPEEARTKVFFACAFGHEDTDILFNHLRKSLMRVGLSLVRIDEQEHSQTIIDGIIDEIFDAKYMIADLTYARPSVYYEIGIAQGLGMQHILTCRNDHVNSTIDNLKIHFDLQFFKVSTWEILQKKIVWKKSSEKPVNRIKKI